MARDKQLTAVILAGGKGTRLRPYTVSLPKPLMPIGEHPIIEIVIIQLRQAGISRIVIAVGYLESLLKAYLGDGSRFGVEISYSSETEPLGTAGPLNLLKDQLNDTFLFMNGDVFTDIDFSKLLDQHLDSESVATVGLSTRKVDIDFGVVEQDANGNFSKWKEKPSLEYDVSMGIYVLEPKALTFLPDGFVNIPDLIVELSARGETVKGYRHDGYWLDIGRPQDYEIACRDVDNKGISYWLKDE